MPTRYRVEFFYMDESHSREINCIHLESLLSWVLNQEGCELIRVEAAEIEEEESNMNEVQAKQLIAQLTFQEKKSLLSLLKSIKEEDKH